MDISNWLAALNPLFASNILGIPAASWALALLTVCVSYLLMQFMLGRFQRWLSKLEQRSAKDTSSHPYLAGSVMLEVLGSTSKLALAVTALLVGIALLDLPAHWGDRIHNLWFLAFGLQLALWINKAISACAHRYFQSIVPGGTEAPATTVSQTLSVWGLQAMLWVIFLLAMLANVGVNITAFVASLGIGGIAVALAVQNILGDLFASLAIAVDKPFEVGDAINVDGKSGTVEQVGLKTTRIRADSGEQIVIANSALLKNTILNYKRMLTRRIQFELAIAFDNPTELAEQIPDVIKAIIETQPDAHFGRAHLKSVLPDKLVFDIVYHMLRPDYTLYMDTQQAINLGMLKELRKRGVAFSAKPSSFLLVTSEESDQRVLPSTRAVKTA
jgi:small-conductance mechanosensitive channel